MDRKQIESLIADLQRLQAGLEAKASMVSLGEIGIDTSAWLSSLLALSPDVISVLDPQGLLVYLNRVMVPGKTAADLLGMSASQFVPEPDRQRWVDALQRVCQTGQPQHFELQSKGDLWWESRLAPIKNAQDDVQFVLSIGTDTTARRQAEVALSFKEQQLSLAIEASRMGQWHWDVVANRFTWDVAARKLFEWGADDNITYEKFLQVVHPDDRARVEAHISQSLATLVFGNLEYRVPLGDGRMRWVLASGKLVADARGQPTVLVGGMVDVSSSKIRDAGIQRAHKLEAIGQLAGGVAHDFNNLLVAITGSIELARRESDPAVRDGLLQDGLRASQNAADLTRQLLVFSRRQPLHESAIDLNSLLTDTIKLLRRLIPESIAIDFIEGHRLPPILGDRGQIEQVVLNLCINARDAMPSGGRLVIETESVLINGRFRETHPWARPGRYVLLSVSDSGIGMSAETMEKIFEPFFTTKEEGTGLGLATAYAIVNQHGGLLHPYSEPGKGSTFKVYLPVADRDAGAIGAKIETPPVGGSELVLLAEDEEPVRNIVRRILTQAGYTVLVATDGVEAVRQFAERATEIRLVILDAIMPRMNGTQALEEIRKLSPAVPALISSGYSDALASVRQVGVAFLQKPYEPDALVRAVREILDNKRSS